MNELIENSDENELTTELADMRRLQQISTKLMLENKVDQLYQDILDAAIILLRSDMGSMQVLLPEKNELLLLVQKGFHPFSTNFWKVVKVDSGSTCAKALAYGKRIITPDVECCDFIAGTEDLKAYRLSQIRSVQTTPLISRDGKIVGMISTHWKTVYQPPVHHLNLLDILARQAADLIERCKAEETLRESEERLRSAVSAAALGTFIWNMEEDEVKPDVQMLRLLGRSPDTPNLAATLRSAIHPEDLEHILKVIDKNRKSGHAATLQEDIRIFLPSGELRWMAMHMQVHFAGDDNKVVRLAGCVIDITNRKTLEQHKDEFIGVASHELKTPVTSIKAYIQFLLERFEENTGETNYQIIKKLGNQVDRLIKLIHRLLDTTKAMGGQLKLVPEKTDLNSLVREYLGELQSLTKKHQLLFEAGQIGQVLIDKDRIGQVITNLVSNAIKYSPDGGDIQIITETMPNGHIKLRVIDQGIGIPEEQRDKVFERFFRVNENNAGNLPGMGLGLYICAVIIRQHGGEIGVESTQGKGSAFYFHLPSA